MFEIRLLLVLRAIIIWICGRGCLEYRNRSSCLLWLFIYFFIATYIMCCYQWLLYGRCLLLKNQENIVFQILRIWNFRLF